MPLNIVDSLTRTGADGTSGGAGTNGVPGNTPNATNGGNGTDGDNATPAVIGTTFTGDAGGDLINFTRGATGGSGGNAGYGGNGGGSISVVNINDGPNFHDVTVEYGFPGTAGLGGTYGLAGQAVVRYADLTFNLGLAVGSQNTVRLTGNATGGQGGAGGTGGDGGSSGQNVTEVLVTPGSPIFTSTYLQMGQLGANGANGFDGVVGGFARTAYSNVNVTGDSVALFITGTAAGHAGGQGGNGGNGGDGGAGGGIGGNAGAGGLGAQGLATLDKLFMTVTGGLNLQLTLDATAGQGANGGRGGVGGLGSTSNLTNQTGVGLQDITNTYATTGNGGAGGAGGAGNAAMRYSTIVGSAAVDTVYMTVAAHGGIAGTGGRGGNGTASTSTVLGNVTTNTIGTLQGTRGTDGTSGTATAEMRNVTVKLSDGDDRLTIALLANGPGANKVIFSGNSFDGGLGLNDRLTLGIGSAGEQSAIVNVGAGTLKMGSGSGGTIAGFEDFRGTSGNDRFIDGTGDQRYTGNLGSDSFVFATGISGADRIDDFNTEDVIRLRGFGSALNAFADVLAHTTDTASGALIQTSTNSSVLLYFVTKVSLEANDFTF